MCKGSHIGTEYKCPICGNSFINTNKGKPRIYCSDNCKDFQKYLNALDSKLSKIEFNDNSNAKFLKGELWRLANTIKIKKD